MARYRKKPVTVDVFQWQGPGGDEPNWFRAAIEMGEIRGNLIGEALTPVLFMDTPKEVIRVAVGDWVIRGVRGELSKVEADEFAAIYEAVE